ncbi:MAG TPA: ABC transporter ATP-binding protein [Candidatus Acidoferrales bacterium]|nr:ABC transporter ATP-binding protein [Candidatus Acidoferrales bacterium]
MSTDAILVENIEKLFPLVGSGWRAFLAPFSPLIRPALSDVTFRVATGESVAIVGANGAGKSTLLRILTTLLLPTKGVAAVAGSDVVREPARVRRSLGFHSGAEVGFYGRLTALQNLKFFAELRCMAPREAKRRISEMAERLGLQKALNNQVRTLSAGTVQRLSLARALIHEPRVLLLDEPTRSLDPLAAAEFRRFLREDLIGRQGATLLVASHSLAEVEELSDRLALLDNGRLLFCGTPQEMRRAASAETLEGAMAYFTKRNAVQVAGSRP